MVRRHADSRSDEAESGRRSHWLGAAALGIGLGMSGAGAADDGEAMQALYAAAGERLDASPFGRPLWIESRGVGGRLQGDIHARVEHPFSRLEASLGDPAHWCELLVLLPNIRRCRVLGDGRRLQVNFARRFDQPVEETYGVEFELGLEHDDGKFLAVDLDADRGPVGTHDYRVRLQAVPVDGERSFLRVHYGYSYGLSARLAAQAYLATRGRGKLGFTIDDGSGEPIGGLRGAVERNAMRLYLAIDAYLDAVDQDPDARHEQAQRGWLAAIAEYPRQLQEADPEAYVEAKRVRL
jgi:hypothetical protein